MKCKKGYKLNKEKNKCEKEKKLLDNIKNRITKKEVNSVLRVLLIFAVGFGFIVPPIQNFIKQFIPSTLAQFVIGIIMIALVLYFTKQG